MADYCIDAILEYDIIESSLAAGRITERAGVEIPLTFDEIADFDDFIDNVCGVIVDCGFEIIKEEQSSKSYSYYVDFIPTGASGELAGKVVTIRFRISDHDLRRGGESVRVRRVFKSFVFGGERYPDSISLIDGVEKVCLGLVSGLNELRFSGSASA